MNIPNLSMVGGILFLLTIVHFFSDWIFQSHKEAMEKYKSSFIRARHCFVYTIIFIPFLFLLQLSFLEVCISSAILFLSHFIEDSYMPVYLWTKYIRRPEEMIRSNNEKGFLEFANTTLGKILVITVDQIIHVIFLIPIAIMAIN